MKKQRNLIRIIHLFGGAAIGTYVYSPFDEIAWFSLLMQTVIIPLLVLTGVWLWKPQWFRTSKKPITALLLLVLSLGCYSTAQGQDPLVGGSGGFMFGFRTFDADAYQFFVQENGPQLGDNLLQVGGEGYVLINRLVIGGGGYYLGGDEVETGDLAYEIDGGGGYFNVGYLVYKTDQIFAFPYVGAGLDALGIERRMNGDISYDPGRFLEASYFLISPLLDLGAGL
ncbi:MAG: hypothetical protein AAFU60_09030, partial [Bacteroidota bacterium]